MRYNSGMKEKGIYTIVALSDVHYDSARLERLLPIMNGADYVVFCGDGMDNFERISGRITVPTVCARGNNDFFTRIADSSTFTIGNTRIFVTHGHRLGVRSSVEFLAEAAAGENCTMAFYGHTHLFFDKTVGGVHIINPGALCNGSYAVVTGGDDGFICRKCSV